MSTYIMSPTPFSPYSSFFTSGLLSGSSSPCDDPPPSHPNHVPKRRGSRRKTASPLPSLRFQQPVDESSAFYMTLQPRRDATEFRSFLSLDLAESQSLRSASLRHKASFASKSTSLSARFEHTLPPLPLESKARISMAESSRAKDGWRRRSRKEHRVEANASLHLRARTIGESSRALPSPKPAPSSSLPDLPEIPASFSQRKLRTSRAPRLPPLRTSAFSPLAHAVQEEAMLSTSSLPLYIHEETHKSSSSKRSSSISFGRREGNHSATLARLEGRCAAATSPLPPRVKRNFMDMSDDEDDEESVYPHTSIGSSYINAALARSESLILQPAPQPPPRSSELTTNQPPKRCSPPPPASSENKSKRSLDSLLPLVSFIDFWDDDRSRNWISFIEVSSAV